MNCEHTLTDTNDEWIKKCTKCNKTTPDMHSDPDDIDPTTRVSLQPHGKSTLYCNACSMYVTPTNWQGEEVCPYHQRVGQSEDGPYLMYDEFDQDGNAY